MIEWPEAALLISAILGFAGPTTMAIFKWVPKRLTNGQGEHYAKAVDVIDLRARVPIVEQALKKEADYLHDSIHDIRNKLSTLAMDQALMKQTLDELVRHSRRRHHEDDDQ